MGEKHSAFIVVLEEPVSAEWSESVLLAALHALKGVVSVTPVPTDSFAEHSAELRLKHELWEKVRAIFYPELVKK